MSLQWGVDCVLPLRTTLLRCFFTRESEDLSTATFRRGPLLEDSRRGVCWRVGFPVCCFLPCGICPRGVWGLCPLRSSDDAVSMIPSPHPEPTSGCSEPDSGWQSAAARPSTTLSVPAPGRPPDHHRAPSRSGSPSRPKSCTLAATRRATAHLRPPPRRASTPLPGGTATSTRSMLTRPTRPAARDGSKTRCRRSRPSSRRRRAASPRSHRRVQAQALHASSACLHQSGLWRRRFRAAARRCCRPPGQHHQHRRSYIPRLVLSRHPVCRQGGCAKSRLTRSPLLATH